MSTRVRRNIAHVSASERRRHINTVVAADQRFWPGGPVSYWDFQDLAHQATHIHSEPSLDVPRFLLWHRELCNRYEKLLQEIDPESPSTTGTGPLTLAHPRMGQVAQPI